MKILFIDNASIQNSIRISLMEQMAHHDVHLISDFDEAIHFYETQKPDMVVIDFSVPVGHDALQTLLERNPKQAIITLSDSLDCSEIIGCDHCLEHYNKKRLFKTEGIHDLLYTIENFDELPCPKAHICETLDTNIISTGDNDE
jgi:DNA-binding NarL/FixJ family response regulator